MPDHSAAFLDGLGIPVELSEVESALDRLWGPAAETAGGPELERPAVTRVALANVMVVRLGPRCPRAEETVRTLATQYPSRIIAVRPSGEPGRAIAAEVSAQCHLPSPARPQVCSEVIVLGVSREGLDLVPGAIRPLLESDLHTVLWWGDPPGEAHELLGRLAEGATRVVLDRPDPDPDAVGFVAGLDPGRAPLARDIAWFPLTPWRELIAASFDPPALDGLGRIASVRVRAEAEAGDRPTRAASWLVAWLAGQLDWRGGERSVDGGRIEATFDGPAGPIAARIETTAAPVGPDARLVEVEIDVRPETVERSGPGHRVAIRRVDEDSCEVATEGPARSTSRVVAAHRYDASRRIASAMATDRRDPPYRRAWPIARWLLGG